MPAPRSSNSVSFGCSIGSFQFSIESQIPNSVAAYLAHVGGQFPEIGSAVLSLVLRPETNSVAAEPAAASEQSVNIY